MARTPKAKTVVKSDYDNEKEIPIRLEIVKLTVPLNGFMELELPVQLSIIETLTQYVLTGKRV
jgi:hypothetical protein